MTPAVLDKEELRAMILATGAVAVGFARIGEVDAALTGSFHRWLGSGCNGTMSYMANHELLRRDPATLLDGARTLVSIAYPYNPPVNRAAALPRISRYALGEDYHKALRRRLKPVARELREKHGVQSRICIDSAPLHERYWALRAGVGRHGENGCIIVDGYGSFVFLAELLITAGLSPDSPSSQKCIGCGLCRRSCPGNAIAADGTIDARRCLSYLTIEHRGPLSDTQREILDSEEGRATLYGCDICQSVCPHNRDVKTTVLKEFFPSPKMLTLNAKDIALCRDMGELKTLLPGTPMCRADFESLKNRAAYEPTTLSDVQ